MSRIQDLLNESVKVFREEGAFSFLKKTKSFLTRKNEPPRALNDSYDQLDKYVDVLFVNGCDHSVPHPIRYRVDHQREQLAANGVSSTVVYYRDVVEDHARLGRTIIIFRCPLTESVENFIHQAKKLNKKILFDVDDLVIDTCYTDQIPFLATLSKEDRAGYDNGVRSMKKTLQLCDGAITSTDVLANELAKYVPTVFVNRNVASEEMALLSDVASQKKDVSESDEVVFGYFSGSITHNDDFEIILPVIKELFEHYPHFSLKTVGELDLPEELEPYHLRIKSTPFVDWRELPELIASVDVNIAPLADTLFNTAKSENKWVEASLVKVPTIASNIGAFSDAIQDGETGLLCDSSNDWLDAAKRLIEDCEYRKQLGDNAYRYAKKNCLSTYTGGRLAHFLQEFQAENLVMVLPGFDISGGILVALEHLAMLQDAGVDVVIFNRNYGLDCSLRWYNHSGHRFPVFNHGESSDCAAGSPIGACIDRGVATFWSTLTFLRNYDNIDKIFYLVQGFETDFYPLGDPDRLLANSTYTFLWPEIQYVAVSEWCQSWLLEKYSKDSFRVKNGISRERFYFKKRNFNERIRILIEGDSDSPFKNVDESFRIVNELDPNKFEIWYMSNHGTSKPEYRVDRNLGKVPFSEVPDIYRSCHILLKTSTSEGFSYPPLEMMSTGGCVVALINEGNSEYLTPGVNCLTYPPGDVTAAAQAIENIVFDETTREQLIQAGLKTAEGYDWSIVGKDILQAYCV